MGPLLGSCGGLKGCRAAKICVSFLQAHPQIQCSNFQQAQKQRFGNYFRSNWIAAWAHSPQPPVLKPVEDLLSASLGKSTNPSNNFLHLILIADGWDLHPVIILLACRFVLQMPEFGEKKAEHILWGCYMACTGKSKYTGVKQMPSGKLLSCSRLYCSQTTSACVACPGSSASPLMAAARTLFFS